MRRVRKGFKRYEYVDRALDRFLSSIEPLDEVVDTPVEDALWRVLAEDVVAGEDNPPFDRSAMDGYAVRSVDLSSASDSNPIRLNVIGYSTTGRPFKGVVKPGEAVKIDTGAEMPKGADAVVMVEYVEEGDGYVDVYKSVSRFENVSLKGEDVKKGDVILPRGRLVSPEDLPTLLSICMEAVKTFRRVRVGLIAFGDELVDSPGVGEGFIRESNRLMIRGLLANLPVDIVDYGIVRDSYRDVEDAVSKALDRSDLVVSTGGTSLGDDDVVAKVVERLGEIIVHGVALQPSKPVLLGLVGGKPYIGLPGYPVAAAISSHVFLIPSILKLSGARGSYTYPVVRGILTRRVPSKPGLRHFVRVRVRRVGGVVYVEPIYASGAGVTSSLSRGDGFLVVPEDMEGFDKGSEVEVILYRRVVDW